MARRFRNRRDAGDQLASLLAEIDLVRPIALGLPRGGVPVGARVADALDCDLDVVLVRKLGVPIQPELAMGAIGEGGFVYVNDRVVRRARITPEDFKRVETVERRELARQAALFRGDRPPTEVDGRTAIVVDDGIATGSTARIACESVRARGADSIVLAAPVAPREVYDRLGSVADAIVVVTTPRFFGAIGQFYDDFSPTTDREVVDLLSSRQE